MKKVLFFMALLMTLSFNAQTTIFEENFDAVPDFEIPSGWSPSISYWYCNTADENGFSGKICSTGKFGQYSRNLITPSINLAPNYSYSLSLLIMQEQEASLFSIYVLPANSVFTGNETPIFQQQQQNMTTVVQKNIDLSAYAGQDVKVYFRMTGLSSNSSAFSVVKIDDVKITQQAILGTSEIAANTTMGIYPNPSSDFVNLKTGSKITKTEVFDMAGRKVNVAVKDDKIDVRALQPGTYIINAETKTKKYSQKFIKK